jgi:predicted ATPase/DNA-binding CsgD family transcriptional regulator
MTSSPNSTSTLPNLTAFIGRQDDLQKLHDLIQKPATRLVTLLGPGGIGKTRLALALLELLQPDFPHGSVFVPLAQLTSVDEVLPALAARLGVQSSPNSELKQAVLEHLAEKQAFLVLDNFENLLEGALLVRDLLAAAPALKVCVTSREKLGLECEILYRLRGLTLPHSNDLDTIENYEAVQLFLQKARQARPDFALDDRNAEAVRQLCEHVSGSPLGILLAAAWVEHFSPGEILYQISQNLDLLYHMARDADPRHSSMRAVFDSAFQRLDEPEKIIFRKLAYFRGGFDLAAAKQIAGADLRALIRLVDKSMLWRDPSSGRYDLHELLRQYAGEGLQVAGESRGIRAAHTRYYLEFVSQQETLLTGAFQNKALDEIQADFDNIRQAFTWAVESRDFELVRIALPGLYAFCDHRSRFHEGAAIFHYACRALAPSEGEAPHPTHALALLSWYDMRTYHEPFASYEAIASMAEACLVQATLLQDEQGIAASLVLSGAILEDQLDFEAAIQKYELAMRSFPKLDDNYWVNMRIGLCHLAARQFPEAIRAFQVSLRRGQETGEQVKTGWALVNIADTLLCQSKPAEAKDYLERASGFFTEVNTQFGIMWANYSLSRACAALGELESARAYAESALQIARQVHSAIWAGKIEALLKDLDSIPTASSHPAVDAPGGDFSPRELEVLHWLRSELTGPEIAERLVVSLNTVRFHTKNIYQKLGVNSRLEAIRRAKELGL